MSTAHRPTWVAALGGAGLRDGITSAPTHQKSSKDMPAHTKLKYRKIGQDAPEELQARKQSQLLVEEKEVTAPALLEKEDEDIANLDADTDIEEDEEAESSPEEYEEDDEDETAELLRELEKIKREREEQKAREAAKREQEILSRNPLINLGQQDDASGGFAVKRRWDDDVIFKNQAKGLEEKPKKRFINDTTRSDFHRKFLDKYIL